MKGLDSFHFEITNNPISKDEYFKMSILLAQINHLPLEM